MNNVQKIALVPGDGIGPEVISAAKCVLEALSGRIDAPAFDFSLFDWGTDRFLKTGRMMPENGLEILRGFDAILFGSAGDPRVEDHVSLWGLRLAICQGLDQFANIRPSKLLAGVSAPIAGLAPGDLDWVIVRENSEGEYSGAGGRVHVGLPAEVGVDVTIMTRHGVERIMRYAFELAAKRPRKLLTMVTKSNAQRHAMVMWDSVFDKLALQFPHVAADRMLVDAMTVRMVCNPQSLDTIVASNLHADILSDLAAALSGSIGIAATANLCPDNSAPSMFEPIHGSAFDLAGKGVANPIGTLWSAVLMLEHLGHQNAANALMQAIEEVLAEGVALPRDLGGTASTDAVTQAVITKLSTLINRLESDVRH